MAAKPADPAQEPSPHKVVVPGQTVVLQINNEQYATCQAKASGKFSSTWHHQSSQLSSQTVAPLLGTVKLGKMACSVAELLGVAWGARLQVIGRDGKGHLVPLDEDVLQAGLGDTSPANRTLIS